MPGLSCGKLNRPASSVFTDRLRPFSMFATVTMAPGIAAPAGSVTDPAIRQCHDNAGGGISGLCPATASARRGGLYNRIDLSVRAPTRAVLPEALFPVWQYFGDSAAGSRLPIQQRWDRCWRQSAEWKRLRESPERVAFE